MKTQRTCKEISKIVATTIKEIRIGMITKQENQKDNLIKTVCEKNKIGEKHIRKIAGW